MSKHNELYRQDAHLTSNDICSKENDSFINFYDVYCDEFHEKPYIGIPIFVIAIYNFSLLFWLSFFTFSLGQQKNILLQHSVGLQNSLVCLKIWLESLYSL